MNATDKKNKPTATVDAAASMSLDANGLDCAHARKSGNDESRVSDPADSIGDRVWPDSLILLVHIILPIAITGAILGRKAIFTKLSTHLDKSIIAVFCPSFSKREKLKKWLTDYLPGTDGGLIAMWKDGSLMCTLINSVVPGACPNPHRHWKKPPIHGQALAYKYLGVIPVFSETDFLSQKPTTTQEKLLIDYIATLQLAIEKISPHYSDINFSTRYIARGMGLVTGEQHRRTVIYIYPNLKCQGQSQTHLQGQTQGQSQSQDDLLVNIRGPYNTYGATTLKALSFARDKHHKAPEKRPSFLKSLSTDFSNLLKSKERGPACDIDIKTEFEQDRAKLIFVPNNSGVYEICLTTNGEHIAGSPFNLSVEKNRSGITQDLMDDELVRPRVDAKSARKKVLNTVIYYEKLRKSGEAAKVDQGQIIQSEDRQGQTEKRQGQTEKRQGQTEKSQGQTEKSQCQLIQSVEMQGQNKEDQGESKKSEGQIENSRGQNDKSQGQDMETEKTQSKLVQNVECQGQHVKKQEQSGESQGKRREGQGHSWKGQEQSTEGQGQIKSVEEQEIATEVKKTEKIETIDDFDAGVEEKCEISLPIDENSNFPTKKPQGQSQKTQGQKIFEDLIVKDAKNEKNDEYTVPILETLDQLNNLLESTEKLDILQPPEEQPPQNFGLNIIDTLRNIPELKKLDISSNNYEKTENFEEIPKIKKIENGEKITNFEIAKTEEKPSSLEDSGTYNDDIDPDSLSSSLEMQGSSEEISLSGGTSGTCSEHEVNNNDIMVKSNEDICYLILNNQNSTERHHKRVYSKDFISCKEDEATSKDDLSKSDSNLHHNQQQIRNLTSKSVSALSQDSVQETPSNTHSISSRMFPKHSQEAPAAHSTKKFSVTRSHSYSHGCLDLETNNSQESSHKEEGNEFKEHFMRRKAFWTNMSRSNVSLTDESRKSSRNSIDVTSITSNYRNMDVLDAHAHESQPSLPITKHAGYVSTMKRSESARNLELRSRSLDFVRQRKKADAYTRDGAFGSADDLNFPSVRQRREVYLNEQRNQMLPGNKSLDRQEIYAVRGEKCPWSIHDKIKSFETGPTPTSNNEKPEKLQSLPENLTVTTKIKERFEQAHNYFRHLEQHNGGVDKRRHSIDGESCAFISLQEAQEEKQHQKDAETTTATSKTRQPNRRGNTIGGMGGLRNARTDEAVDENNELQRFLNERRKRRQSARMPAVDVFN